MPLIHPVFDPSEQGFVIKDPIKTLYIKTEKELISDSDYYVSLTIGGTLISFTNQFKKVIVDNVELYELNLFENRMTLMMNLIKHNCTLSLIGWYRSPVVDTDVISTIINVFCDVYYETDEIDLSQQESTEGFEQIITYVDSPLSERVRQSYGEQRKIYGDNVDNVLRYLSGFCGTAYSVHPNPIWLI